MKLTFVIPPEPTKEAPAERTAGCTRVVYPAPNIYELYVVAMLEKHGYDVSYVDFVYDNQSTDDFARFIANDVSDIYYIWSVNLSRTADLQARDIIRKAHPEAYICFLGPGATYFTKLYIDNARDAVVRGEPEYSALEWTNAVRDGSSWSDIKGLSYWQEGKLTHNPPRPANKSFDDLPFPARHHLAQREFHNPKLKLSPYTTMITSRNCPFKCIYCVPSSLSFARELEYRSEHNRKPPISYRSIENIEAELKELHEAGYKAIGFMDDEFIWTEERTADLCRILKKYDFRWGCQARVDTITEPIAKALGESGCLYVDLGIESFNDEILKYIKKGITREQIYNAIHLLKKYKVPVKLNILIGTSPLETKETLRDTLRQAQKLRVDQIMFNIVSPFPGTEFYKLAKENGWIAGGEYTPTNVQRESILNYPHLSAREMEKILYRYNLRYFLSPYVIWSHLRRFTSWSEFFHALKALKIKLFG